MKKILNILITIFLFGIIAACQEEISFMQVSSDKEYHLTTKGGKIDINVNASQRPTATGLSTWLHTEITDLGPEKYLVTIKADRNLSGMVRKAEAVIRVNDELKEYITIHQEYRKDTLKTKEKVLECLPEVTEMSIDYSSTLPVDSLILLCEAPYVKATLTENRINLSLDLNIGLYDRSFDVVLTTADEYINTLTWTVNQRATVRNAEGMVQFDDAAFKRAVLEKHDTDGDGDLSIEEAEAIEHLDVSGRDIRNLNGVEPMRNLRSLDFSDNPKLRKHTGNVSEHLPSNYYKKYDPEYSVKIDLSDPHPYLSKITIENGVSMDISGCAYYVWVHGFERSIIDNSITSYPYIYNLIMDGIQIVIPGNNNPFDELDNKEEEKCNICYKYTRIKTDKKSTDFSRHGEKREIMKHSKGNGIPLTLTLCGFLDTDLETEADEFFVSTVIESLFKYEPFKSMKDYFDVNYIINVYENRFIYKDNWKEWVLDPENPGHNNEITEQCNIRICAGLHGAATYNRKYIMLGTEDCTEISCNTLGHECGHLIGKLEDEYSYNFSSSSSNLAPPANMSFASSVNVSKTPDPELVPWSRFLTHPDYMYKVGIYEGAAQYKTGIWKSIDKGMMLDNNPDNQFSAVSRWGIFRQIMIRSDEWRKAFINEKENDIKEFEEWFVGHHDFNDTYTPTVQYWKTIEERMTKKFEDWCFEEFVKYDVINKDIPY